LANVKITDLTAASTPLAGTELLEIVQGGASRKVAASDIAASASNVRTVATGGTGASTLTGYVKGNGTSAMTAAATVPFLDLAGRAFAQPSSTIDQTGNVAAATAVTFNTDLTGTGVSVVASTQITFTAAGTYMLAPSIQFKNTDSNDHDVTVWFRKNGTNIANSATILTVPKAADGGSAVFSLSFFDTVTAGQYIEIMWLPENVAVTIEHFAAGAIAPAIPSIICPVMRIA
jgi:putative transposon-encoded protein